MIRSIFRIPLVVGLVAVLLLAGCGTTQQTRFLHKNADLAALSRVAVLPFDNLSAERVAGDKVQKIFYLELLSLDVFEIADPGEVKKTLQSQGTTDALGPADYQRIGKALNVDGVFVGSVVDYGETRSGNTTTPEITIQLRLIETATGSTVWSVGQTRSGASIGVRLFGVGGESMTEAARRMIRTELRTLLK